MSVRKGDPLLSAVAQAFRTQNTSRPGDDERVHHFVDGALTAFFSASSAQAAGGGKGFRLSTILGAVVLGGIVAYLVTHGVSEYAKSAPAPTYSSTASSYTTPLSTPQLERVPDAPADEGIPTRSVDSLPRASSSRPAVNALPATERSTHETVPNHDATAASSPKSTHQTLPNQDGTPASPAQSTHEPAPNQDATAASLFAEANQARRNDEIERAISLYLELERRFPDSNEAAIVPMSLAHVYLDRRGDPQRALVQFDRYLAKHKSGPLREEALVGRALCFQRMGKLTEERAAWQRLLVDYPGSLSRDRAGSRM